MKNLKKIRLQRNMTQAHLGALIGITAFQISKYETRKANPSLSTVIRFLKALKCTFEELCL